MWRSAHVFGLWLLAATAVSRADVHDVVIVGLGPAGLAALTRLAESGQGYKVVGLEAKDRIGGRVNTQQFGGGLVEFGAEWIHGETGNPTYKLARDNGVPILDTKWRLQCVNNGGYNLSLVMELYDYCEGIYGGSLEEMEGNITLGTYIETKFKEYIASKPGVAEDTDFCNNFLRVMELAISGHDAFDSWHDESLRSAQDYRECPGSQGWSWHRLGYKTLFDILLHKYNNCTALPVDIRLDSEVTSIDWSRPDRVSVTAAGQLHEARVVIVTVSLGVLKHSHKSLFHPALPEGKQTAISALSIGVVDKICLHYDTAWWGDITAQLFLWTEEDRSKLSTDDWWITQIYSFAVPMSNPNVISFWITGAAARHMEALDLSVVKSKVEALLDMFYKDVPRAKDIRRSTWFSDPHTRGSYSYHGVATDAHPDAAILLAEPVGERLYFAGEATNPIHFSTVHGALETGWREAERLLQRLKETNETTTV